MGIEHDNADVGAEMDSFREAIAAYSTVTTRDEHTADNASVVEYINAEGDPPFIKYRLTLEAVEAMNPEEVEAARELANAEAAKQAAKQEEAEENVE